MASIIPSFAYDIFISYRHKDNLPSPGYGRQANDGWVSEFVANLRKELEATFKEDVSIYFDENPHDGLLETHHVQESLEGKLNCLIFIPIISQTYCDPKSFAWQHEFLVFNRIAKRDGLGRQVKLSNGNVASRILPVKIHEIDERDRGVLEHELGSVLRSIDFIYKFSGVNRPLRSNEEHPDENNYHTTYRNQINKVANAVKDIISVLQLSSQQISANVSGPAPARVKHPKAIKSFRLSEDRGKKTYFSDTFSAHETKRSLRSIFLFSFGPALLLSLITGFLIWNFKLAPDAKSDSSIRTTILLPEERPLAFIGDVSLGVGRKSLSISKDGKRIAYVARYGETTKLMIRDLDDYRVHEIDNTEGAFNPVFSADGKYLSFFQKNYVKQLSLQSYTVALLAEQPDLWDATWSTAGELFFSSHQGRKLFRYFTELDMIADNSNLLFAQYKSLQRIPESDYLLVSYGSVVLINLKNGRRIKLGIDGGTNARYVDTGHIVFLKGSSLMAVAFDLQKLAITSKEIEILSGIRTESVGDGQFDFAFNGNLVYVEGEDARKSNFVIYDDGKVEPLDFPSNVYSQFALSPEGDRIAVSEFRLSWDIYIYDLRTNQIKRVTNAGGCWKPVWYPDGHKVFFVCNGDSFFKTLDTNEEPTMFVKNAMVESFSATGRFAVIKRGADLYIREMKDTTLTRIATGSFCSVSPDGNFFSYTSAETGEGHVYIQSFSKQGEKWQVSSEAGSEESRWSGDGKKLIYRSGRKWMEVSVNYTPSISFSKPKILFEGDYINVPGYSYDISRQGERFLLLKGSSERQSYNISMIQGWFYELNNLVPATNKNGY